MLFVLLLLNFIASNISLISICKIRNPLVDILFIPEFKTNTSKFYQSWGPFLTKQYCIIRAVTYIIHLLYIIYILKVSHFHILIWHTLLPYRDIISNTQYSFKIKKNIHTWLFAALAMGIFAFSPACGMCWAALRSPGCHFKEDITYTSSNDQQMPSNTTPVKELFLQCEERYLSTQIKSYNKNCIHMSKIFTNVHVVNQWR